MRVIIAGGGTGGHVFPGLAVAEEFTSRDAATEVLFIGTESGIEASVVPRWGYPIRFLRTEGLVGGTFLKKVRAVVKAALSTVDSYRILQTVKPDIAIGVGGYASGSVMLSAYLSSIPTMILEQNSVPGLTNKILGRFVDAVCVTYQESISYFEKGKTFLTGNPVRSDVLRGDPDDGFRLFSLKKGLFTIFVFGGSSGARSINRAVVDSLQYLQDLRESIQFLHQTGPREYEQVRQAYREKDFRGTIAPFIHQMGEAYAVADLVVSRAGATTLAEVTALGKPAVLVPYPFAAGRHQEMNAMKLEEIGAAKVILDQELRGEALASQIRDFVVDDSMREEMRKISKSVGRPDAGARVVDIALSLIKQTASSGAQSSV